jgi:DNA-binding response OmpR family regulator
LIADDRQLMRSALKTAFAMRPKWEICGEATDGREAVRKVSELQPDLILMDFKMPLADSIQAAREISATATSIPIVMHTLYRTGRVNIVDGLPLSPGQKLVLTLEGGRKLMVLTEFDGKVTATGGFF